MEKTSVQEALPKIQALLQSGQACRLVVTGNSMLPFLRHEKDAVILAPYHACRRCARMARCCSAAMRNRSWSLLSRSRSLPPCHALNAMEKRWIVGSFPCVPLCGCGKHCGLCDPICLQVCESCIFSRYNPIFMLD